MENVEESEEKVEKERRKMKNVREKSTENKTDDHFFCLSLLGNH